MLYSKKNHNSIYYWTILFKNFINLMQENSLIFCCFATMTESHSVNGMNCINLDRDVNAAMNILKEGLNNISAGTVEYTDGADVRPFQGQSAMKSEAHESSDCG